MTDNNLGFRFTASDKHHDRLEFDDDYGIACDIQDYRDALSFGSYCEGDIGFTLSREKVETFVRHLQRWLKKGTLDLDNQDPPPPRPAACRVQCQECGEWFYVDDYVAKLASSHCKTFTAPCGHQNCSKDLIKRTIDK